MNFFAELKRRHIYRVAAAYAVVAWVLIQLVSNVSPMLRLPDWAGTLVLVLLFVGFPVALLFAWIQQLAPESGALAHVTTGKLDWFIAGALIVVIGLVSYQQFAPAQATRTADSQQAGVVAARAAAASPAGAISIAVLPFANVSIDPGQDFFSDGMTDEIAAALSKIPDLRVVGRTSAFQFKGEKKDLRAIGQALNATHLIEGSVRKVGDRVRVTAQLVQADNGLNVWTDTYDRELTDMFAIQEDIATAIAGALRMPLGLKPGERLVSSRAVDAASYQEYLRAKPLVRARAGGVPAAIKILEPLVARNPDYAPALALLSQAYGLTPNYARNFSVDELRRVVKESLPKAEAAARRAIQLDPDLADGYLALGRVQSERGKSLLAEDLFSKALALDANNPDGLNQYSNLLANVGRLKEALAMKQQLQALEPYVPNFNTATAEVLWLNRQNDAAIAMLKDKRSGEVTSGIDTAMIYASMGRYTEAADVLQVGLSQVPNLVPVGNAAAGLLRAAPKTASLQNLPRLGRLSFIYLYVGAPSRALENYEDNVEAGYFSAGGSDDALLWHPSYTPVRITGRFKAFVRKSGYVEYWRAKGWPEFCHPTTADDFGCT